MRYGRVFFFLLGMWVFTGIIFSQNLTVTKVGEWGTGQYREVFIQGNYAYCAAGYNGLDIIDISNPIQPRKAGHYGIAGNITDVYLHGSYAYVIDKKKGLLIIDVSISSHPSRVGFYSHLTGRFNGIYATSEYAYLTDHNGVHIIDISTPSSPFRVSFIQRHDASEIIVNGHYAYVCYVFGFTVFDVSNPFKPKLISDYFYVGGMKISYDFFISNHYVYLLEYVIGPGDHRIQVVDISNLASPTLVGEVTDFNLPTDIYVSGNYAYLTDNDYNYEPESLLKIYDISNPSYPDEVSSSTFPGGYASSVFVKDNYAYVSDEYLGLQVFEVSNPRSPVLVVTHPTISKLTGIDVRGQYAFAIDYNHGLLVLDITNAHNPAWVGHMDTPGRANDIMVNGNYVYIAGREAGLQVISITNPRSPKLIGDYNSNGDTLGIFVKNNRVYLADGTAGIKIIDISHPAAPSLLSQYDVDGKASGIFTSGNYAYLAEQPYTTADNDPGIGGGLKIFDISNPSAPVLVSQQAAELKYSLDVYVENPYAYVITSKGILCILDISSPLSPRLVGKYQASDELSAADIYFSGNYVYLALDARYNYNTSMKMIDVSSPSAPCLAADYSKGSKISSVFVTGNNIYITDGMEGKISILQVSSPTQTAQMNLSRSNLCFGSVYNGISTGTQAVLINNSGEGQMEWSASADQEWLKCTPASGTNSGELFVSVDVTGISPGTYTGTLSVSSLQAANSPQTAAVTLKVYKKGNASMPFGFFATPLQGSVVMGSIAVTGWVLDDIGIHHVKIYHEEGSSLVYIGDAVFAAGARPNVELAYPNYPQNDRAGWGYMLLTNFLPDGGNGTFSLHAIATDFEGYQVTLGTKTIYCDNANAVKPFGAIDTPTQGGIAAGSEYVNFGWALTPLPNTIPKDGSTITVWVDGMAVGHPVYNRYREDVAALFPGYNNSDGAVGYYYLDSTQYENGVHTIQWTVTDDAGNTDGIGSRYFTIRNQGQTTSQTNPATSGLQSIINIDHHQIPVDDFQPIYVKKGYNQDIKPQIIYPDNSGNTTIEINQLERVEIRFPGGTWGLSLMSLPTGSTFDKENGIFSWQPGPGYLGDHELVFFKRSKTGEMKRQLITVRIRPQFE